MTSDFLLYGSNGFVGSVIARRAVEQGLNPILAGRSEQAIKAQASQLGLEHKVFRLEDEQALEEAVGSVQAVLHCAGPYIHTFEPMVEACLRQRTHYMDITGEIPVLEQLQDRDQRAKQREVMILPAVGFDVVPTDCLAVHLKNRLPSATRLALAFHGEGPAGMPPGTANTLVEMLPHGIQIRRQSRLVRAQDFEPRRIDFGAGPRLAYRLTWGDIFTAYFSTGIPNIQNYTVLSKSQVMALGVVRRVRPLFNLGFVRRLARQALPAGSTEAERAETHVHVWGEVKDEQGRRAAARLHGPEGGVEWTSMAALTTISRVLNGQFKPGFQTPASVYGPDFVLEVEGVQREDLP